MSNAEPLKLDNSPNIGENEVPVAAQSPPSDAHVQRDSQFIFGEPRRYEAEVPLNAPAWHDEPLLCDAQRAEQQLLARAEESITLHSATMCSTLYACASAAPSDTLADLMDEPLRLRPRPARNCNAPGR